MVVLYTVGVWRFDFDLQVGHMCMYWTTDYDQILLSRAATEKVA